MSVAVLVVALDVLVVATLVWCVIAQRRRIAVLEGERVSHLGDGGRHADVIAIEIRNHGDVAARRSSLARPLAVMTPGLLRSIVHRETVRMLRVELAENGVDAEVTLRRIAVSSEPNLGGAGSVTPPGA